MPEMLNVSGLNFIHKGRLKMSCMGCFKLSPPVPVFDKHDGPLTSEEEEQRAVAKIKMLGNIKFIGELGKLNLIHESILHRCIKTVSSVELHVIK